VAARLVTALVDAQSLRGVASVVLTGGTMGAAALRAVRDSPARPAVDWRRVDVWWGDERWVAADSPDRNDRQAREALLDAESPIFFRLPQVLFPYASSLILHPEKQPDARDGFRVHARSTPKALRETTANVDLKVVRQWRPVGEFAQYNVAASVQGPLRNAFPGPSTRVPTASPRSSRVLVIASSQFFANPFARAAGGDEMLDQLAMPYAQQILTHTILVARNMVEWMTLDDDLVACARIPNGAR